jgi:hypothetical protein
MQSTDLKLLRDTKLNDGTLIRSSIKGNKFILSVKNESIDYQESIELPNDLGMVMELLTIAEKLARIRFEEIEKNREKKLVE